MLYIILLFVSIFLSAVCKAVMDVLHFNFSTSVFKNFGSWWNPSISWRNKWKDGNPNEGEKFPGSSTIFVGFTDAWHLFQHFNLMLLFIGFILYSQSFPLIDWVAWYVTDCAIIYASYTFVFEVFYKIFKND